MGFSDLNLRVLIPYLPVLGWGAIRTLEVSALAIALSFPLGLVGALMRLSDNRLARSVATVYVETIRNIPVLVVLYILFLVLPLYGIPINALTAGVLGLPINSTAFTMRSSAPASLRSRPVNMRRLARWACIGIKCCAS